MLQINPKKFKNIENKSIPSPLRPKFRNKAETNIYFLSKRKFQSEKKQSLLKNIKLISGIIILVVGGYLYLINFSFNRSQVFNCTFIDTFTKNWYLSLIHI